MVIGCLLSDNIIRCQREKENPTTPYQTPSCILWSYAPSCRITRTSNPFWLMLKISRLGLAAALHFQRGKKSPDLLTKM